MTTVVTKHHIIIEETALQLAAVFYEVGRSQGLTSIHKNARLYAKANLEKFIPKATDLLLDMLNDNSGRVTVDMKESIYNAIMERQNDPELNRIMPPNIDVKKLMALVDAEERKKVITINTNDNKPKTILHDVRKPNGKKQAQVTRRNAE